MGEMTRTTVGPTQRDSTSSTTTSHGTQPQVARNDDLVILVQ